MMKRVADGRAQADDADICKTRKAKAICNQSQDNIRIAGNLGLAQGEGRANV
jgi:hypothetical protein